MDLEQRYAAIGEGADRPRVHRQLGVSRRGTAQGRPLRRVVRLRLRQRHELPAHAGRVRVAILPRARSIHRWRETLRGYLAQQYGQGYGRLDIVWKHPGWVAGDAVSPSMMMAHAPLMAAALASGAASLLLRAAGLPWRQAAALARRHRGRARPRTPRGRRPRGHPPPRPRGPAVCPAAPAARRRLGPRHRRLGRPPPGRSRPPPVAEHGNAVTGAVTFPFLRVGRKRKVSRSVYWPREHREGARPHPRAQRGRQPSGRDRGAPRRNSPNSTSWSSTMRQTTGRARLPRGRRGIPAAVRAPRRRRRDQGRPSLCPAPRLTTSSFALTATAASGTRDRRASSPRSRASAPMRSSDRASAAGRLPDASGPRRAGQRVLSAWISAATGVRRDGCDIRLLGVRRAGYPVARR